MDFRGDVTSFELISTFRLVLLGGLDPFLIGAVTDRKKITAAAEAASRHKAQDQARSRDAGAVW